MAKTESSGKLVELAKLCREDSDRWFAGTSKSITHHTLGMAGEVGEFANLVKKVERGSLNLNDAAVRVMLAEELTDAFTYMLNIAAMLNVDLERSFHIVRGKNETRFMAERAKREEKKA